MTRSKRDFGTIRRRSGGRYQAFYMGPDAAPRFLGLQDEAVAVAVLEE